MYLKWELLEGLGMDPDTLEVRIRVQGPGEQEKSPSGEGATKAAAREPGGRRLSGKLLEAFFLLCQAEERFMSRRAARLYGSERVMLTRPFEVKRPSGTPIRIEETCTMIFPLGSPHERRLEIPALVVDMLEQCRGFLWNIMWKWEMQLGKADAGILPLLQAAQPGDHQWDEMTLERVRLSSCGTSRSTWKLLVCKGQQSLEHACVMDFGRG